VILTGSSGGLAIRVIGKSTSRPSIAMFGVVCVTLRIVMRYAARMAGSRLGQSVGLSCAVARNICSIVRFARSVWPSERGRNGEVRVLLTPAILHSSWNSFESKCLP